MNRPVKAMRGFSLIECAVVVAIVAALLTVAIINTTAISPNQRADAAADAVLSQLRLARMAAITQRRNVVITLDTTFATDSTQHVNYQIVALPGDQAQPLQSMPLPVGTQFVLEAGVPDTPMQFGNSAAIFFSGASGGSTVMQFTPSGALTDGNNNILNGTIFVGVPNTTGTARAVTIMGGAGNIQRFRWAGSQWSK